MTGQPDPRPMRAPRRGLRPRPKKAATAEERSARLAFKVKVLGMDRRCLVHVNPADCEGDFEAHHVVTQQQLEKAGREDLLWDWRNGMTVCNKAHRRHTRAIQRIPIVAVPERAFKFAQQYGFDHLLSRYYTPTR